MSFLRTGKSTNFNIPVAFEISLVHYTSKLIKVFNI